VGSNVKRASSAPVRFLWSFPYTVGTGRGAVQVRGHYCRVPTEARGLISKISIVHLLLAGLLINQLACWPVGQAVYAAR
jgi:hypothetical protein